MPRGWNLSLNALIRSFSPAIITSDGGYRDEKKSPKHWSIFNNFFFFSHLKFCGLGKINSNFFFLLPWKKNKNMTEPNELDEPKKKNHSTIDNLLCSLVCFLVVACSYKNIFFFNPFLKKKKISIMIKMSNNLIRHPHRWGAMLTDVLSFICWLKDI